jgi:hypothetical protein
MFSHYDESPMPVSILDLQTFDIKISSNVVTEKVADLFHKNPDLPGVMIVDNEKLIGVITRVKLFERLGHRYGVELFLQKPIIDLHEIVPFNIHLLPGYLRLDEAVEYALIRKKDERYDPIVLKMDSGEMRLLDANLLLLTQSRSVVNLSGIVGEMEQLDMLISSGLEQSMAYKHILTLLRQVVPYHQATILLKSKDKLHLTAFKGYTPNSSQIDLIQNAPAYKMMQKHRQPIFIPEASRVPAWKGMEALGLPLSWLGVPIYSNNTEWGLLSISRNVNRVFTTDERKASMALSQRVITVLTRNNHLVE